MIFVHLLSFYKYFTATAKPVVNQEISDSSTSGELAISKQDEIMNSDNSNQVIEGEQETDFPKPLRDEVTEEDSDVFESGEETIQLQPEDEMDDGTERIEGERGRGQSKPPSDDNADDGIGRIEGGRGTGQSKPPSDEKTEYDTESTEVGQRTSHSKPQSDESFDDDIQRVEGGEGTGIVKPLHKDEAEANTASKVTKAKSSKSKGPKPGDVEE